ncbi:hypothetical protein D3C72_1692190 [compost metagenome]
MLPWEAKVILPEMVPQKWVFWLLGYSQMNLNLEIFMSLKQLMSGNSHLMMLVFVIHILQLIIFTVLLIVLIASLQRYRTHPQRQRLIKIYVQK